jgi:hypothetical protein
MNLINRWKEYDAGKLTPPCVVQHDTIRNEHLIWVWDGETIKQFSRSGYDEKSVLADAMIEAPVYVDSKDVIIEELETKVSTLEAEKAVLISEKKALVKDAEVIKVVK